MDEEKTISERVREAAIKGVISVPALTSVVNEHFGTNYRARKNDEGQRQTPLYQAIARGNLNGATPPAHMRGRWVIVDQALKDYLAGFHPRQV